MRIDSPFSQDAAQGVRDLHTSMVKQIKIAAEERYYVEKSTDSCKFDAR